MNAQAYTVYGGVLTIAVATPRPEEAGSVLFTAAKIHEDYCATVRALLMEHKQVGPSAVAYPAAKRIQTYFPAHQGQSLYALRELMPAGSPRDIDTEFMLEIMRIRYSFTLALLPSAFIASETVAAGIERNLEYAVQRMFQVNGVPDTVIPGDDTILSGPEGVDTSISISCDLGPASHRSMVNVPTPS